MPLLGEASTTGQAALGVTRAKVDWWLLGGWWRFRKRTGEWRWGVAWREPIDGWAGLEDSRGRPLVEVRERRLDEGVVEGEVRVAGGTGADWLRWRLRARPGERFLGFGERFNAVDQTGNRLYVWTEEGAFGLGERLGRWLEGVSWNPFPNGPTTAYKPMPFFMSDRGYGLLLDTFARVEYDVAATDPAVLDIVVWDDSFRWLMFYGPEPARILERFTAVTGRATVPAPWVFAPWNDAIKGSASVRAVAKKLRDEKIPTTALWTEDWQGGYWLPPLGKSASYMIFPIRYDIDRTLYPDAEEVAEELHESGFRWLSYFFPYLLERSSEYREARAKGFLLRDREGGVSRVHILWHRYGHVDLTNPEARDWYMGLVEKNVRAGFDGYMADFGEYVPPGAIAGDGEIGVRSLHNRMPLLWQQMHREFWDRRRPDGDYVFFCRSASVGSQSYAPVFWSGDSNTDFERYDGLPSNLPAALSAGLCGLPIWAADIGGYMSHTSRARDKELYFRWTELAALLPVMRTHHGTHPRKNWTWDSDDETLAMFKLYCRLHTALFPYLEGLAHESAGNGMPAVRHMVLHYPGDRESWRVEDQFLLGDRLLVAPVLERNSRGRSAYFPPGDWVDYWTGEVTRGPERRRVCSRLDNLPLYVRSGAILPTIDMPVDTLAPSARGVSVVGYDQAVSTLRLTLYGAGEDELVLPDGTTVSMWRTATARPESFRCAAVRLREGAPLDFPAPDKLQPVAERSGPLAAVSVGGGETIDLLIEGVDGARLAGAHLVGGRRRIRITFEWR
jgi:alpha-glucosidase (family GH31 glycosyl hydrolase)